MADKLIPRTIHYCWFGRGKLPELVKTCMASWRKQLPGYEIREWNEDNFNINANVYCRQAYEMKKWAFVADYARLAVLLEYGGLYLDTDVEVLCDLEGFRRCSLFLGMEDETQINAAILGARAGHPWLRQLVDHYGRRNFITAEGEADLTTIVSFLTGEAHKIGFSGANHYQVLKHDVHIFPTDYFYPVNAQGIAASFSSRTCSIHHFSGSWLPPGDKLKKWVRQVIGPRNYMLIRSLVK